MELEKLHKKRAREGDHEDHQDYSKKMNEKKQDVKGIIDFKENNDDSSSNVKTLDSSLALDGGVFDFPWLKDGMISKSEDWRLEEDAFSSSLIYDTTTTTTTGIEVPAGQCLCQTPEQLPEFPEDKFDDDLWRPVHEDDGLEMEGVDCIWSSLLSQPLQQGGI
jgi:hypothetical protein